MTTLDALRDTTAKAMIAFGALACALTVPAPSPAAAQGTPGGFLIYGNFCGPGNRGPGYPPIDALDLACAHHDACSPEWGSGRLPSCSCNRRLQIESSLVARDPRTPQQTRDMANFIANFAGSAQCR